MIKACNTYSEVTGIPFEVLLSTANAVYNRTIPALFGRAPETHRGLYEEVTRGLFAGKIIDVAAVIRGNRRRYPSYRPVIELEKDLPYFLREAAKEAEDNLPVTMLARHNKKVTTS